MFRDDVGGDTFLDPCKWLGVSRWSSVRLLLGDNWILFFGGFYFFQQIYHCVVLEGLGVTGLLRLPTADGFTRAPLTSMLICEFSRLCVAIYALYSCPELPAGKNSSQSGRLFFTVSHTCIEAGYVVCLFSRLGR